MTDVVRLHVHAVGAVMGGATRHLEPFLRALTDARPGWQVHVWHTAGSRMGSLPENVTTTPVPAAGVRGRLAWENRALPAALVDAGADALLCLTNSGPLRPPVPMLLYQRNALWFDPAWVGRLGGPARAEAAARRGLAFAQARAAATVLVPSGAMAGFLTGWPGWPSATEVRVVPHAVDVARFTPSAHDWPPPADRPLRLVSVGHAAPHKDQGLLVEAVAALRAQGREVRLDLTVDPADDPPYVRYLDEARRRLDVEEQVTFVGRVADVEHLYAEADALIVASISESFGFPLIEAMASGLPIVASAIPATSELAGDVGWLFRPGDVTEACRAVLGWSSSPADEVARRLAVGHQRAGGFSWVRNANSVAAAVASAVSSR